jgi:hypothetical protein
MDTEKQQAIAEAQQVITDAVNKRYLQDVIRDCLDNPKTSVAEFMPWATGEEIILLLALMATSAAELLAINPQLVDEMQSILKPSEAQ